MLSMSKKRPSLGGTASEDQSASALRKILLSRSPASIWTRGLRDLPTSVKGVEGRPGGPGSELLVLRVLLASIICGSSEAGWTFRRDQKLPVPRRGRLADDLGILQPQGHDGSLTLSRALADGPMGGGGRHESLRRRQDRTPSPPGAQMETEAAGGDDGGDLSAAL